MVLVRRFVLVLFLSFVLFSIFFFAFFAFECLYFYYWRCWKEKTPLARTSVQFNARDAKMYPEFADTCTISSHMSTRFTKIPFTLFSGLFHQFSYFLSFLRRMLVAFCGKRVKLHDFYFSLFFSTSSSSSYSFFILNTFIYFFFHSFLHRVSASSVWLYVWLSIFLELIRCVCFFFSNVVV